MAFFVRSPNPGFLAYLPQLFIYDRVHLDMCLVYAAEQCAHLLHVVHDFSRLNVILPRLRSDIEFNQLVDMVTIDLPLEIDAATDQPIEFVVGDDFCLEFEKVYNRPVS